MRTTRRLSIVALTVVITLVCVPVVSAHPLGNFTINQYAGLDVSPQGIQIDYILDMAEIPAFLEISSIDKNQNDQPDADELVGYPVSRCEAIRPNLDLGIDGRRLPLSLQASTISFPPGQAGLLTLRLNCIFTAEFATVNRPVRAVFENHAYEDRIGWREIVVNGAGVSLEGDFANTSISDRLVSYPQDLLSSPLDQRELSLLVGPGGNGTEPTASAGLPVSNQLPGSRNDAFTRLILMEKFTLPTILLALAISFGWGAMHAMTPGHGKTIVGAYLVGSRGTALHALYLGLTTTITHTAGVFALGAVTIFASRFIFPERLFPWLSFISGILVVGIGVNLFLRRLRSARQINQPTLEPANHNDHSLVYSLKIKHGHQHYQEHPDGHDHEHDHEYEHRHMHPHDQDHNHSPGGHPHLPPGADGAPVTWRSLLALGITGGLLPCPSALVVLLSAIALGRVGFGLVLVVAFSLGLASVLSGMGLIFVYAGKFFNRLPVQGRMLGLLPTVSALFIALVGLGITARALMEIGVI
ncbi:MAG TPA: hypothetical protein VI755_05530 [Anaerolineales bacterium]|nr:hypothetical protein [Anaerolineales bacterium]